MRLARLPQWPPCSARRSRSDRAHGQSIPPWPGSGYVPIREMVRAGIWFNPFGVEGVAGYFMVVGARVFGIAP